MASIDDEIQQALDTADGLIRAYVAWGEKVKVGETHNLVYSEVTEFVNFRVETADSCLHLIKSNSVADALGLCRALLENYMLLMLMCRGRKYFRIVNLESKSPEDFKEHLEQQVRELEELRSRGEADALYVAKYPRAKRCLMYVFEGLTSEDEPDFFIPAHYFHFQEFMPEALRLKDEEYFEYYPASGDERRMQKDRRREADNLYRFYLSYDALRVCLELNEILDDGGTALLEAHYTFLGKFLHPTHNAARELHANRNYLSGRAAIGMGKTYTKSATLLAALYVTYLLAGILDELVRFFEQAPKKYVDDAGTSELRTLVESVPGRFPYFWFLFNRPPLWDKYNFAIHHVEDQELAAYGGYEQVPDSVVPFDSDISKHLESALTAWGNNRVGAYNSPLADVNAAPKFILGFPVRRE
ncbi:hypothetical protein [Mycobacterium sp. 141]|uniref:hypothetical protein n=1 Tax=Mycobacterium sp. 141 TaxID=1120797 RepID=UPI00035D84C3|nr:hypothetical protein [Mycobacterium sp. 141]